MDTDIQHLEWQTKKKKNNSYMEDLIKQIINGNDFHIKYFLLYNYSIGIVCYTVYYFYFF